MNVKEIQKLAKERGLKTGKLRKAQLVHAIQEDEGNFPCYASATEGECDQADCIWREDCLKEAKAA